MEAWAAIDMDISLKRALLYLTIFFGSYRVGFYAGHDDGFTMGHKLGKLDMQMEAKGKCFLHNGRCE